MMPANAKVESAFFALISKNHKENLGNSLLDETIGKIELSGLCGGEAGFEGVAEGHELIDFGYDAVLFGEGWERKFNGGQAPST